MNTESKSFCWVCGNSLQSCVCGKERVVITVKNPNQEILPEVCTTSPDFEDLEVKQKIEVEPIPRTCCNCGITWYSNARTRDEWTAERCPSCGAK